MLGFLPSTEVEVLGLWGQTGSNAEVIRDLHERGVERIAMLVDAGWHATAADALCAYPRARGAPSTEHFVRSAAAPLSRKHRDTASAVLRAAFDSGSEAALLDAVRAVEAPAKRGSKAQLPSRFIEAQLLLESLDALSDRDRRFLLAADRTATVVLEEITRAVRRNGYFMNQDAAIEFIARALLGAERRMDRERAAVAAEVRTPRAVPEDCLAGSSAV